MPSERATVSIADLSRLREQDSRPAPLVPDETHDYALAALVVLRGLSRGDKLKVIRRMRALMR